MTIEEAIKTIELAIAEVEWVYPIDYAAAFDVAVSTLRAQQENPFGGWISVKDGLPELGERVLCTDGHCVFEQYRVLPSCVYGVWDRMGLKSEMQDVTHWMPLPEPPKEV